MSLVPEEFPDRFVEVGVAEANMISAGAGFAKTGFIPIIDTFGQFGVTKGNLPLTMSALSQAPVIAVFSHVGFQDAADGASHQATTYFAATSAIPHTVVIACSCADEAEALDVRGHQTPGRRPARTAPMASRLSFLSDARIIPSAWMDGAKYPWGKAQVLAEGATWSSSPAGRWWDGRSRPGANCASRTSAATVISNAFINRVDVETIGAAVRKCAGRIVTIEDHQIDMRHGRAGFPRAVAGGHGPSHGVPGHSSGEFGQSAWVAEHLYEKHGLTAAKLIEAARGLLQGS